MLAKVVIQPDSQHIQIDSAMFERKIGYKRSRGTGSSRMPHQRLKSAACRHCLEACGRFLIDLGWDLQVHSLPEAFLTLTSLTPIHTLNLKERRLSQMQATYLQLPAIFNTVIRKITDLWTLPLDQNLLHRRYPHAARLHQLPPGGRYQPVRPVSLNTVPPLTGGKGNPNPGIGKVLVILALERFKHVLYNPASLTQGTSHIIPVRSQFFQGDAILSFCSYAQPVLMENAGNYLPSFAFF
ncbi:hypothetical protein DFH29DRAFT_878835 [Suillus ampliporus]|nr:hypothetical protein DFH29DRAFT_878835 [Suillus ampliporus]